MVLPVVAPGVPAASGAQAVMQAAVSANCTLFPVQFAAMVAQYSAQSLPPPVLVELAVPVVLEVVVAPLEAFELDELVAALELVVEVVPVVAPVPPAPPVLALSPQPRVRPTVARSPAEANSPSLIFIVSISPKSPSELVSC
jgi:hypothetical protein